MQAVIFIGVQATGKSTFYKERFADTHVRINLDMLKSRHREELILNACLEGKTSFVVDNTNTTVEGRKRYILPAKAAQFEVVGYYFEAKLADSLQRNKQRKGEQRIPEGGVRAMYRRLQIPSLDEGFDKLYIVKINPSGAFNVEELQDNTR